MPVTKSEALKAQQAATASVESIRESAGVAEVYWDFWPKEPLWTHRSEDIDNLSNVVSWEHQGTNLLGVWHLATEAIPQPGVIRWINRSSASVRALTELDNSKNVIREGQLEDVFQAGQRAVISSGKKVIAEQSTPPVPPKKRGKKDSAEQQDEDDTNTTNAQARAAGGSVFSLAFGDAAENNEAVEVGGNHQRARGQAKAKAASGTRPKRKIEQVGVMLQNRKGGRK